MMNNVISELGGGPAVATRGRWATESLPVSTEAPKQTGRSIVRQSQSGSLPRNRSKAVEIDASVLIKIMKHCREYFPTPVNGLLLGLDTSESVEVTDCFGLQNKRDLYQQLLREKLDAKDVDEKVHLEDHRYQVKMLEQLNMVNADCCNVGWYQTLQFNDLKDPAVVEGLCEHQELARDSLVIGFDPQLSDLGASAFRAFRVTGEVLNCKREAEKGDPGAYSRLCGKDLLIEVPLIVRNSLLVQAFLTDWLCRDTELYSAGDFDVLEFADRGGYVEKSLGFVIGCLDDLQTEQEKLMKSQKDNMRHIQKHREQVERRRLENEQRRLRNDELLAEIPPIIKKLEIPSQLPTLLMSNHVGRITEQISSIVSDNLSRSFFLHKETSP